MPTNSRIRRRRTSPTAYLAYPTSPPFSIVGTVAVSACWRPPPHRILRCRTSHATGPASPLPPPLVSLSAAESAATPLPNPPVIAVAANPASPTSRRPSPARSGRRRDVTALLLKELRRLPQHALPSKGLLLGQDITARTFDKACWHLGRPMRDLNFPDIDNQANTEFIIPSIEMTTITQRRENRMVLDE